jgi:1,4-alpha-glucan branching enzyme
MYTYIGKYVHTCSVVAGLHLHRTDATHHTYMHTYIRMVHTYIYSHIHTVSSLGFTCIELMPITEFGGAWGYNPRSCLAVL